MSYKNYKYLFVLTNIIWNDLMWESAHVLDVWKGDRVKCIWVRYEDIL